MGILKKLFRNKKGNELIEKIMIASFSIAAGSAVILYTSNVIIDAKNGANRAVNNEMGEYTQVIEDSAASDGLIYELVGDNYKVTGYEGTAADVVIPSTHDGKNVTTIGFKAFYQKSGINSITLGYGISSFERWAFAYSSISTVTIPNSITSIYNDAFHGCGSLAPVYLPKSVTTICGSSFQNCYAFTTFNIPKTVTTIGAYAFGWSLSLETITYEGTIEEWSSVSRGEGWTTATKVTAINCSNGVANI